LERNVKRAVAGKVKARTKAQEGKQKYSGMHELLSDRGNKTHSGGCEGKACLIPILTKMDIHDNRSTCDAIPQTWNKRIF
jgi:hypothetical protein